MPSHADRIRRHDHEAEPQQAPLPTTPREALKRHWSELERYAGWLAKDRASAAVRADVKALGLIMDVGTEASTELLTLDQSIGRLPGGDMRKMLRKALAEIRVVLGPTGILARDGEAS
jgi:hypothetical protein